MNTDKLDHLTMYQPPAQQTGVQTFPGQQPAVGSPQGHGPLAQPITYQMSPSQPQPVFIGQPDMGQQGNLCSTMYLLDSQSNPFKFRARLLNLQ